MRLLFWRATPDAAWPYTTYFKGDAAIWLEYAGAIRGAEPFELGLPIHPPGAAYAIALLWDGDASGIPFLRFVWCVLGAAVPPAVFLGAARSFGRAVARLAGALCAASTGLLLLSTSLNSETPYLLLVCASLWFVEDLRRPRRLSRLALFSALNGAACLFRVEHVLFFALAIAFFAVLWTRAPDEEREATPRRGRVLAAAAVSVVFFLLPLIPWQERAWAAIRRFNVEPRRLAPAEGAAIGGVEQSLSGMRWDSDALRRRDALPAFARRTGSLFVAATVVHRGGREVRGEDFRILEEAFGYSPRPLARFPFVSSYGPLNFSLANHAGATGGFDSSPLEQPPPLAGGAERYPPFLVRGLPPPQLAFVYPPHLRLFNEGYALGWSWIVSHPAEFARLAGRKLSIFWSGAALGFTGYGLPLGLSGVRRAVDLVVPEGGAMSAAWRVAVLAAAALGLAAGWRRLALWPWLLLLGSKVAVTVLFFGYARQGATVVPVLSLLFALAVERWLLSRSSRAEAGAASVAGAILVLAVGVEAIRFASGPTVSLDGRTLNGVEGDPFPASLHRDQRLQVR